MTAGVVMVFVNPKLLKKQQFDLVSFVDTLSFTDVCFAFETDRKTNRIERIYGAFTQITGYSSRDYVGSECLKLMGHCPKLDLEFILKSKAFFLNYLYGQPKEKREAISLVRSTEFVRNDGHISYLNLICKPVLFNKAMRPTRFVYVVSDITHLKSKGKNISYVIDCNDKENIIKLPFDTDIVKKGIGVSVVEQKILRLLAEGDKSKVIAEKLFLSKHTIMTHRKNMLSKFDCSSTAELIKKAFMEGWI